MKVSPLLFTGLPEHKQTLISIGRSVDDPETIIEVVCERLEITREELMSKSRKKYLTEARCIAIGLILHANKKIVLKKLGVMFGNRDHSTIIYNRQTYNDLFERDKSFTQKVKHVLKYV